MTQHLLNVYSKDIDNFRFSNILADSAVGAVKTAVHLHLSFTGENNITSPIRVTVWNDNKEKFTITFDVEPIGNTIETKEVPRTSLCP